MEEGKQSSSSLSSSIFGAKDPCSSSQVLTSIFAPPPTKVAGGESLNLSENEKKNRTVTGASMVKTRVAPEEEEEKKEKSWCYGEEKVEGFQYSSSIYYGAQDVYSTAPTTHPTSINKDGGEDESGSACRGNWWQGSLYY